MLKKEKVSHGFFLDYLSISLNIPLDKVNLLDKTYCWALACQSKDNWEKQENFEIVLLTKIIKNKLDDSSFGLPLRGIPLSKFNTSEEFTSNIEFAYYRAILLSPDELYNAISASITTDLIIEKEYPALFKIKNTLAFTDNGLSMVKFKFKDDFIINKIDNKNICISMSDEELSSFLFPDKVQFKPKLFLDHLLCLNNKYFKDLDIIEELKCSNFYSKFNLLNKENSDKLKYTIYNI